MADFQKHLSKLNQLDVGVVALSVDQEQDALKTVERHELEFPVLYGLNAQRIRNLLGAYIDEENEFLHATNFILRDGQVIHSTYSSGPLGRLQAEHVAGLVEYYRQKKEKD